MRIHSVHYRELPVPPEVLAGAFDSLSTPDDRLWPTAFWPPIRFDRPLQVGAVGGHGPIRYTVETYVPGQSISFRFTAPPGFTGTHSFLLAPTAFGLRISHEIRIVTTPFASLYWLVVIRPLHDALIEDALHRAVTAAGLQEPRPSWSFWVRLLRAAFRPRKPIIAT
ncbi:MAG: hypothetical protein ROZ37_21930 [Aromatoleum sp.]|uniref:hypothetical protein n=1 Tax=Aromatoleum sp. TaxID=2307007 RepID=UPI002893FC91|nr:hypothetical protein [Aromatoleum sp.]MDT3672983.1 hypothetical protein [Aromatoleum sp.]